MRFPWLAVVALALPPLAAATPVGYVYTGTVTSAVAPAGVTPALGTPVTGTFSVDYGSAIAGQGSGVPGTAPWTAVADGGSAFPLPVPGFVFAFTVAVAVAGASTFSYASTSEGFDDYSDAASSGAAFTAAEYSAPAAGTDTSGAALSIVPASGLVAYSNAGEPLWSAGSSGTLAYQFYCATGFLCQIGVTLGAVAPATDAPQVLAALSGAPAASGWYTTPVTLAWGAFGNPAPVTSGCTTVAVPNTRGTTYTCTATNALGSATQSVTVREDTVAPSVTVRAPRSGARYRLNEVVASSFRCTDATSGVASCVGTVPDGGPVPTAAAGTHTFTVVGTDHAGNVGTVTSIYTVE